MFLLATRINCTLQLFLQVIHSTKNKTTRKIRTGAYCFYSVYTYSTDNGVIEIYSNILGINLKYLSPLFQWHACKLAKLSACKAKCMTTVNTIYIFKFFTGVSYFATGRFPQFIARVDKAFVLARQQYGFYESIALVDILN